MPLLPGTDDEDDRTAISCRSSLSMSTSDQTEVLDVSLHLFSDACDDGYSALNSDLFMQAELSNVHSWLQGPEALLGKLEHDGIRRTALDWFLMVHVRSRQAVGKID